MKWPLGRALETCLVFLSAPGGDAPQGGSPALTELGHVRVTELSAPKQTHSQHKGVY